MKAVGVAVRPVSAVSSVEGLVGEAGLHETPSQYVRDLIGRDMEQREGRTVHETILSGYRDLTERAMFESTGDFRQDMRKLAEKETDGWR